MTSQNPLRKQEESALRYAFHETRWCKDGARAHTFAHGDDDEAEILREHFMDRYEAVMRGDVVVTDEGEDRNAT